MCYEGCNYGLKRATDSDIDIHKSKIFHISAKCNKGISQKIHLNSIFWIYINVLKRFICVACSKKNILNCEVCNSRFFMTFCRRFLKETLHAINQQLKFHIG